MSASAITDQPNNQDTHKDLDTEILKNTSIDDLIRTIEDASLNDQVDHSSIESSIMHQLAQMIEELLTRELSERQQQKLDSALERLA